MTNAIKINNIDIQVVEYQGQRVVTYDLIDKIHERPSGTARKRFSDNQIRFKEGKHFFRVQKSEKRTLGINLPNRGLTLITEKGYLLLVKSFTDDLAWKVQEKLIDGYFRPKDPMVALNDPAALRSVLLTYSEKVIALEETVQDQAPKVAALDRIATADGSLCITSSAKHLQVRPKELFDYLSHHKWIYRRAGNKSWLAYQNRIQQGVMEHKVITNILGDGIERIYEQARVTPKGIARLARIFEKVLV